MRHHFKLPHREALAWVGALCLFALWSDPAWAQVGGEIPGGTFLISMMDSIVSAIRVNIGPIVVGLCFFGAIFSCLAGDFNRGGARAAMVLVAGAFIAGSTLWWPWIKTWFVA